MEDVWIFKNSQWIMGKLLGLDNKVCKIKINDFAFDIDYDNVFYASHENPLNVKDLIKLSHLNEPSILNTLRVRYNNDNIYTDTGPVLIAINPFKNLDIYSHDNMKIYQNMTNATYDKSDAINAHVYKMAQDALHNLLHNNKNQTILATGESGSGKTVTTKHILHYLTNVSSSDNDIKDVIVFSNPLIEAFGNAKTIRNDNSSRFGKFIQLFINPNSKISSGLIETYLLEKIRVIKQNTGERNFHIFYQLLSSEKRFAYGLSSVNDYNILNNKDTNSATLSTESDSDNFEQTLRSFDVMGFSESEIHKIFTTISLILNFGNFKFSHTDDGASVIINENVYKIIDISSWTIESIADFFCHEYITVNGEVIKKNLNIETAVVKLHTFIQELYQILFNFITNKINYNLQKNTSGVNENSKFIGILDIFGFEIFDHNSLEQLHINYTNECLQQIFNKNIFKTEQEEYMKENINWNLIKYIDNIDRLNNIDGKLSIFSYLDEECFVPNGSDLSLLNKIDKINLQHAKMTNLEKVNGKFMFEHYAGDVQYSIHEFVHKNKHHTNSKMLSFLNESYDILIDIPNNDVVQNNSKKTISAIFKAQLYQLAEIISNTENYFVRCIKPNDTNNPNNLDISKTMTQLKYGGITEAVKVVQAGFPIKLSHAYFRDKYYPLTLDNNIDFSNFKTKFLKDHSNMQIGTSKIFMKHNIYETLENLRYKKTMLSCTIIQSVFKMLVCRKKFTIIKQSSCIIQSLYRGYKCRQAIYIAKRDNAIVKIQSLFRGRFYKNKFLHFIIKVKSIQHSFRIFRYNKNLKNLQCCVYRIIVILHNIKLLTNSIKIQNWFKNIKKRRNDKIQLLKQQFIDENNKMKLLAEKQSKLFEYEKHKFEEEINQFKERELMYDEEKRTLQIIQLEKIKLYEQKQKNLLVDLETSIEDKHRSESDFQNTLKVNESLVIRMTQLLDENEQAKVDYIKMQQENENMKNQLNNKPTKKSIWSYFFKPT